MNLALKSIKIESNEAKQLRHLKIISKFWSLKQWALYLKTIESTNNEEEIYVGSTSDLEEFVSRKSYLGFVPAEPTETTLNFKKATEKK